MRNKSVMRGIFLGVFFFGFVSASIAQGAPNGGKSPCDYLSIDEVNSATGKTATKTMPIAGVTCMYVPAHVMTVITSTNATMDIFNKSTAQVPNTKPVEGIGDKAIEILDSTDPTGGVSVMFIKNKTIASVKVGSQDQNQSKAEALAKILASKF